MGIAICVLYIYIYGYIELPLFLDALCTEIYSFPLPVFNTSKLRNIFLYKYIQAEHLVVVRFKA